jgi:hypothetical protein
MKAISANDVCDFDLDCRSMLFVDGFGDSCIKFVDPYNFQRFSHFAASPNFVVTWWEEAGNDIACLTG